MTNQVSLNVVLGSDSVTADSLASDSVTADSLASDSVTADSLASDSVTADSLANGSVAADSLADGAVTTDKIANDSVTADKIADGSVAADSLADGAVTTGKIANDSVTADKIAGDLLQAVPVGTVLDFAGTTAPSGYLACDGAAVSRTTYGVLFLTIGTSWGEGDGSTTFNLPDFRRRVAVGAGGTGTSALGADVGDTGGAEEHTLATSELPSHSHGSGSLSASSGGSHNHSVTAYGSSEAGSPQIVGTRSREANTPVTKSTSSGGSHSHNISGSTSSGGSHSHNISGSTSSAGGGGAHNNMQPSAVVNKIIKT